ncbi:hypothetical protein D3C71_1380400 [compost metagenome]
MNLQHLGDRHYALVRTRLAADPSADTAAHRFRHIARRDRPVWLKARRACDHVAVQRKHLKLRIAQLKCAQQLLQRYRGILSVRKPVEIFRLADLRRDPSVDTVVIVSPYDDQKDDFNQEKRQKDHQDIV